jgi:methylated-DNA-protein-cysteine methyltransferase-like protein
MSLQEGEVTTYGDIADVAGYPKQARLVGRILATTEVEVPWWRVVNASGKLVAGQPEIQAGLLCEEGVIVRNDRVLDAPIGRFSRNSPFGP